MPRLQVFSAVYDIDCSLVVCAFFVYASLLSPPLPLLLYPYFQSQHPSHCYFVCGVWHAGMAGFATTIIGFLVALLFVLGGLCWKRSVATEAFRRSDGRETLLAAVPPRFGFEGGRSKSGVFSFLYSKRAAQGAWEWSGGGAADDDEGDGWLGSGGGGGGGGKGSAGGASNSRSTLLARGTSSAHGDARGYNLGYGAAAFPSTLPEFGSSSGGGGGGGGAGVGNIGFGGISSSPVHAHSVGGMAAVLAFLRSREGSALVNSSSSSGGAGAEATSASTVVAAEGKTSTLLALTKLGGGSGSNMSDSTKLLSPGAELGSTSSTGGVHQSVHVLPLSAEYATSSTSPHTAGKGGSRGHKATPPAPVSKEAIEFLITHSCLQEEDIGRLGWRLYFGGSNRFGSPWVLPSAVPAAARRFVRTSHYLELAAELRQALNWPEWEWEQVLYAILGLLVAPIASYFLKWRRRIRVGRLLQLLLARDNSHRWLRGAVAVALQDNLRLGVSGDFTLAYIDILRNGGADAATATMAAAAAARRRRNAEPQKQQPLQPQQQYSGVPNSLGRPGGAAAGGGALLPLRLPLAIILSGDGGFECPHYLDPNDVLVRAVPSIPGVNRFIDNDWVEFVAEFNKRARCLTAGAIIQTSGPLLSFLRAVNSERDTLGGIKVELVRFWPTARSSVAAAATSASGRSRRSGRGRGKSGSGNRRLMYRDGGMEDAGVASSGVGNHRHRHHGHHRSSRDAAAATAAAAPVAVPSAVAIAAPMPRPASRRLLGQQPSIDYTGGVAVAAAAAEVSSIPTDALSSPKTAAPGESSPLSRHAQSHATPPSSTFTGDGVVMTARQQQLTSRSGSGGFDSTYPSAHSAGVSPISISAGGSPASDAPAHHLHISAAAAASAGTALPTRRVRAPTHSTSAIARAAMGLEGENNTASAGASGGSSGAALTQAGGGGGTTGTSRRGVNSGFARPTTPLDRHRSEGSPIARSPQDTARTAVTAAATAVSQRGGGGHAAASAGGAAATSGKNGAPSSSMGTTRSTGAASVGGGGFIDQLTRGNSDDDAAEESDSSTSSTSTSGSARTTGSSGASSRISGEDSQASSIDHAADDANARAAATGADAAAAGTAVRVPGWAALALRANSGGTAASHFKSPLPGPGGASDSSIAANSGDTAAGGGGGSSSSIAAATGTALYSEPNLDGFRRGRGSSGDEVLDAYAEEEEEDGRGHDHTLTRGAADARGSHHGKVDRASSLDITPSVLRTSRSSPATAGDGSSSSSSRGGRVSAPASPLPLESASAGASPGEDPAAATAAAAATRSGPSPSFIVEPPQPLGDGHVYSREEEEELEQEEEDEEELPDFDGDEGSDNQMESSSSRTLALAPSSSHNSLETRSIASSSYGKRQAIHAAGSLSGIGAGYSSGRGLTAQGHDAAASGSGKHSNGPSSSTLTGAAQGGGGDGDGGSNNWWGSFSRLSDDVVDAKDLRLGLLITLKNGGGSGAATGGSATDALQSTQHATAASSNSNDARRHTAADAAAAAAGKKKSQPRSSNGYSSDADAAAAAAAAAATGIDPAYFLAGGEFNARRQQQRQQQQQYLPGGDSSGGYNMPYGTEASSASFAGWSAAGASRGVEDSYSFQFGLGDDGAVSAMGHPQQPAPLSRRRLGAPANKFTTSQPMSNSSSRFAQPSSSADAHDPHALGARPSSSTSTPTSRRFKSSSGGGGGASDGENGQLQDLGPVVVSRELPACIPFDFLSTSFVDVGGHDDAVGLRLDMCMPYPGLRVPTHGEGRVLRVTVSCVDIVPARARIAVFTSP